MKRWNQLLANSAARKKKLLEAQEHFRKVSGQPWGYKNLIVHFIKYTHLQLLYLVRAFATNNLWRLNIRISEMLARQTLADAC